jgi:hypothetical protein
LFFSLKRGRGRERGKEFEILSCTRDACYSLAYILAIDSTSSYEISESKSQTSREDDGNDNREKKERENERPTRWTMMMMMVAERTNSDDRLTALNE